MKELIEKNFPVDALGCMCGTSMDGLDLALIQTDGEKIYSFGKSSFKAFSESEKKMLRGCLGRWPGDKLVSKASDLITEIHIDEIKKFKADLIGFHGQTIAHDPENRRTHQIGSGDQVSSAVKLPTVWDFRTADVKNGGQGAPLTPFFHFACAKYLGIDEVVAFLNLGGVGNLTIVDTSFESPELDGALLAFDTGPANGPIDDLMFENLKKHYDLDGNLASLGTVSESLISEFLSDDYFSIEPPKSLDRNSFRHFQSLLRELSLVDAVATATAACVTSVALGINQLPNKPTKILVSGGGRKNKTLMRGLKTNLESEVSDIDDYGMDGDMLEAQAFGFLAVRVLRGLQTSSIRTTGVQNRVCGGIVSYP